MAFCTNCGASTTGAFCTQCGKPMSSAAGPPPAQSTAQPAAPPVKKGTSPLVWILVAIFGLFLLIGIAVIGGGIFLVHKAKQAGFDPELMKRNPALAMTRMVTALNPNVSVVSVDEGRGRITLRDKQTGKTVTLNFDDVKNGRISFKEEGKEAVTVEAKGEGSTGSLEVKSEEGSLKIGTGAKVPDWIPGYPSSTPQGDVMMQAADADRGSFHFTTKDAVKSVIAFYDQALKGAGFKITNTTTAENEGKTSGMISAEDGGKKRNVIVTLGTNDSGTEVHVMFEVKK